MSSGSPETRKKILQATWALLEDPGNSQVRMSDIAKKAGVSRQALYLHFPARSDLLVATTLFIDEVKDTVGRLQPSRLAQSGQQRLDAFIDAWGNYIPEIYGVARALISMAQTDMGARQAWDGRLQAVREGCREVVQALEQDGALTQCHSPEHATDILCVLLSLSAWEQATRENGWSQSLYIRKTKEIAHQVLVAIPAPS